MAEKSTFFNSVSGDRKYKAEDMAAHFAKLITNGVYPAGAQLQVTEDTGMNVTVSAGSAWINGYAYHNDGDFTLTFDPADGVLDRIDRIVVRWGRLARSINLAIVKGTPGSSPSAPAIVRSADYYDLGIATVSIGAGITAITQAMITDTRLDSDVCGFVSSLIQPDTSDWFTQFNSAFTTALNNNQSTWDTWFATLEDILDENVAGNLLNMINDLAGTGRTNETVKGIADAQAAHSLDYMYQVAGGTGTAITLTINGTLADGYHMTFIASADNEGAATTINTKSVYKPNTTDTPNFVAGKAYTVWYSQGDDCFFIKASAEGTAVAGDVLAGETFSNDNDTGINGTMVDRSGDTACISSTVSGTTLKLLASDGYRDGVNDYVTVTDSNFVNGNIVSGVTLLGKSGTNVAAVVTAGTAYVYASNLTRFTEAYSGYTSVVKLTTAYIRGMVRITFSLEGGVNNTAYCKVYRNGIPVGTERTVGDTLVTFTEDFSCIHGDYFDLYMKSSPGNYYSSVSNFQISIAQILIPS